MSEPIHEIEMEQHVKIPMRDGTKLDATVWRPRKPGAYPVLVERVGYELVRRCTQKGEFFAGHGYVFVGQNVRGVHASEGEYGSFRDDGWGANRDGYDTIEWAGTQSWSNGKVGMLDGSYSGFTQYLVAPTRPPHLTALFVRQGGTGGFPRAFRGGACRSPGGMRLMERTLADFWPAETTPPELADARARLVESVKDKEFWTRHLPLKSCPPLEGTPYANRYFEPLNHPEDGPYWWPMDLSKKFGEVDTPIFHLGGWFDPSLPDTLRAFQGVASHGRTSHCRQSQRLLIGPWIHYFVGKREVGELDFGPEAEFDLPAFRLRWYDHWLKGEDNGVMDGPVVRVFLMGENRWLDLDSWPPKGVIDTPVYFREGTGRTEASLNNGALTFDLTESAERPDSFAYDPQDPISSFDFGPYDCRSIEARVLTYTSTPVEKNLAVTGPVRAVLYGLSSAPDTDWVVRLCDVHPDGRSMSVCDGILRARYRDSLQRTELMVPGQVYRFEVDLGSTSHSFRPGHCLRVQVTSSDFPRYDRNLNTGGTFGEEACGQVAINTVFHDTMRPSHLNLPVYP